MCCGFAEEEGTLEVCTVLEGRWRGVLLLSLLMYFPLTLNSGPSSIVDICVSMILVENG